MADKKSSPSTRDFDVILYGASSFVGRFVAEHLRQRAAALPDFRWAVAGRDRSKLDALKRELDIANVPCLIADAQDSAALERLARATRVVASTVGPYAQYGSALVGACAANGTDYCDLTAEIPWMRRMIDQYEALAQQTGARIVHGCGFDSIPSDLGVWRLQQYAQQTFGTTCTRIDMRLLNASGGFSGGTVASLCGLVEEVTDDTATRSAVLSPYALTDYAQNDGARKQQDRLLPRYDHDLKQWSAPFIMAPSIRGWCSAAAPCRASNGTLTFTMTKPCRPAPASPA